MDEEMLNDFVIKKLHWKLYVTKSRLTQFYVANWNIYHIKLENKIKTYQSIFKLAVYTITCFPP